MGNVLSPHKVSIVAKQLLGILKRSDNVAFFKRILLSYFLKKVTEHNCMKVGKLFVDVYQNFQFCSFP